MQLSFDEEKHLYFVDGVEKPSVTQIISQVGLTDFSAVPAVVMEKAKKFGTATHITTELEDKGQLDYNSLSAPLIPYLNAWKKFKEEHSFIPIDIEKKFFCSLYGYCGTIDRIGTADGRKIILDIKTSTTMSPATAIQTAAYALGINEPKTERWGVQLKADETYSITPYTDAGDFALFLSALNIWRWKNKNKLIKR